MTKCNSTDKKSIEQQTHDRYLRRAIAKYGNSAFDYSNTLFSGSLAEVTIRCNSCNCDFKTNAYMHTRKSGLGGCTNCRKIKREQAKAKSKVTTLNNRARAENRLNNAHGVAFRYANPVVDNNGLIRLDAQCLSCKSINNVAAKEHYKKPSCYSCKLDRKQIVDNKKHKENVARAIAKHGDKYDFSNVFMKNATTKVAIKCNDCGVATEQTVSNIIHNSYGCRNCYVESQKMTGSEFFTRAKDRHKHKYAYKKDTFGGLDSVIKVRCQTHGWFEQVASNHLQYGCRECGKSLGGWSRTRFVKLCKRTGKAILYAIKCYDNNESFYKIGITSNDLKTRFKRKGYLPYDYTPLFEIEGSPSYIFDLEVRLHSLLKDDRYEPKIEFGGYTECFTTIKPVEKLLKELSNTDQLQLIA